MDHDPCSDRHPGIPAVRSVLLPLCVLLVVLVPFVVAQPDPPDLGIEELASLVGDPPAVAHELWERVSTQPENAAAILNQVLQYRPYRSWHDVGGDRNRVGAALALRQVDPAAVLRALEHPHRPVRTAAARAISGCTTVSDPRAPWARTTPAIGSAERMAFGLPAEPSPFDLFALAQRPEPAAWSLAIAALRIGAHAYVPTYDSRYGPGEDGKIRSRLIAIMATKTRVEEALQHQNPTVRWAAATWCPYPDLLGRALADPDARVRWAAAEKLRSASDLEEPVVQALTRALADAHPTVASEAALALAHFRDPRPIATLLRIAAGHSSPLVRGSALLAAAAPLQRDPRAERQVVSALADPDAYVRWVAAQAMRPWLGSADGSLERLACGLLDPDPVAREIAANGLTRFPAPALQRFACQSGWLPALLMHDLEAGPPAGRVASAHLLECLGPLAQPAVPALARSLRRERVSLRLAAIRALGRTECPAAGPPIADMLQSHDIVTRWAALRAVEALGSDAAAAVPGLIALLGDRSLWPSAQRRTPVMLPPGARIPKGDPSERAGGRFRGQVPEALARIGGAAVPALLRKLEDSDGRTRVMVIRILGSIGPEAAAAVPALMNLMDDANPALLVELFRAFGGIGEAARLAAPELRRVLLDRPYLTLLESESSMQRYPREDVRTSAARALCTVEPAVVNAAFDHPYPAIRLAAARALCGVVPGTFDSRLRAVEDPFEAWSRARSRAGLPGQPSVTAYLEKLRSDDGNTVAVAAANLMLLVRGPEISPPAGFCGTGRFRPFPSSEDAEAILKAAVDGDAAVRWGAALAIRHLHPLNFLDGRGVPQPGPAGLRGVGTARLLAGMFRDGDDRVRRAAAESAGVLMAKSAFSRTATDIVQTALESMLLGPDDRLAYEAFRALLMRVARPPGRMRPEDVPLPVGIERIAEVLEKKRSPLTLASAADVLARYPDPSPAVSVLRAVLREGDHGERLLALRALEKVGPAGSVACAEATPLLGDGDPVMRRLAAEVLAVMNRIPEATGTALRKLEQSDMDPQVREAAGFALVNYDAARGDISRVSAASGHSAVRIRRRAVERLGTMGGAAIPYLIRALGDPDRETRTLAGRALIRGQHVDALVEGLFRAESMAIKIGILDTLTSIFTDHPVENPPRMPRLDELIRFLEQGENRELWGRATGLLRALGPNARPAIGFLRKAAASKAGTARDTARLVLRILGASRFTLEELIERLGDAEGTDHRALLEDLGELGPRAARAIPAIVTAAARDAELRVAAAETLGKIGPAAAPATPALAVLLTDPGVAVRLAGIEALQRIGSGAMGAVPHLAFLLATDRATRVRRAAAGALATVTRGSKAAVPFLSRALQDPTYQVRHAALLALERLGPDAHGAASSVRALAEDPEACLEVLAREVLTAIGAPDREPKTTTPSTPRVAPAGEASRRELARLLLEQARGSARGEVPLISTAHAALFACRALSLEESPEGRGALVNVATGLFRKRWETSPSIGGGEEGSLRFFPDGKTLAMRGGYKIRFFDLETGREAALLQRRDVGVLHFSPNGRIMALAGHESPRIELVSSESGDPVGELSGHTGAVHGLDFSPDGRRLASISRDGTIRIWNVATRTATSVIRVESKRVSWQRVALGADRVAAVEYPSRPLVWDIRSGRVQAVLEGHRKDVTALAFSPGGEYLATGDSGGAVQLWNPLTGECHRSFQLGGWVKELVFGPRERRLFVHMRGGGIVIQPLLEGEPRRIESVPGTMFALSPDGSTIAAGSIWALGIWNAAVGVKLAAIEGHGGGITAVAATPDGKTLITAGEDGTVRRWETATGRALGTWTTGHRGWNPIVAVAVHPSGSMVAAGGERKCLRIWHGAEEGYRSQDLKPEADVRALAYAPDGKFLAVGGDDGVIRLRDASAGGIVARLEGHGGAVWSLAFSPDGRQLASGAWDRTVRLWDVSTRDSIAVLEGHTDDVMSVAFHPDGKRIASAGYDFTVRLWDTEQKRLLRAIRNGPEPPTFPLPFLTSRTWSRRRGSKSSPRVAFSPDGTVLAATAWDEYVRFFDPTTGEKRAELFAHPAGLHGLAFLPDGRSLATGSIGGTLCLWNVEGLARRTVLRGHEVGIHSLAFNADGSVLASGDANGDLCVWRPDGTRPPTLFRGHGRPVHRLHVSPDGRWLASVDWERIGRVRDLHTGEIVREWTKPRHEVYDLRFCGRNDRLAVAMLHGCVQVVDPGTGRAATSLELTMVSGDPLAERPDGEHLAVAYPQAREIVVRELENGKVVRRIEGHGTQHYLLAYSGDGRRFATVETDGTARIRDTERYEMIREIELNAGPVSSMALNPDGSLLAAVIDGRVTLFDATTGRELAVLDGHRSGTAAVTFHPVTGALVTGGGDGTIRILRNYRELLAADPDHLRVQLERETGLLLLGSRVAPSPPEPYFTPIPPFSFQREHSPSPRRILGLPR